VASVLPVTVTALTVPRPGSYAPSATAAYAAAVTVLPVTVTCSVRARGSSAPTSMPMSARATV
jgi:hypothetical protein